MAIVLESKLFDINNKPMSLILKIMLRSVVSAVDMNNVINIDID